ncbi:MAG: hypothetical protein LUE98_11870 [Tannerellaceae bacterium]|nr:hypothetical protein [Tannerellaceae bacterium]
MEKSFNNDFMMPFFVANDSLRPVMNHIHNEGNGFVYAADGHTLIRMPEEMLCKTYQKIEKYPNAEKLLNEAINRKENKTYTLRTDDLIEMLTHAEWYYLTSSDPCPKCSGEGTETCDYCGVDHDCPDCQGDGSCRTYIKDFSLLSEAETFLIGLGNACYKATYLQKVAIAAKLSGADEITYLTTDDKESAGIFRFNGINILVMPYYYHMAERIHYMTIKKQ